MKNLHTLLFLMLFSTSMFSQESELSQITAHRLLVINKTQCTQYFVVLSYDTCKCNDSDAYQSDLISIAPNTQTHYDYHNLGGNFESIERGIVLARIVGHSMELPCYTEGTIGQPCTYEQSSYTYIARNSGCKPCIEKIELATTIAQWIPAQDCNQDATLLFKNP